MICKKKAKRNLITSSRNYLNFGILEKKLEGKTQEVTKDCLSLIKIWIVLLINLNAKLLHVRLI